MVFYGSLSGNIYLYYVTDIKVFAESSKSVLSCGFDNVSEDCVQPLRIHVGCSSTGHHSSTAGAQTRANAN